MHIPYTVIYEKAEETAAFEAGKGVLEDGMYHTLNITPADYVFLRTYIGQVSQLLGSLLRFCVEDVSVGEEGVDFDFRRDCVLNTHEERTERHLAETISFYVMSRWLQNKLPERAQAYLTMYNEMSILLVNSATRTRPVMADDDGETEETEDEDNTQI